MARKWKPTDRAVRLDNFLTSELGWETHSSDLKCVKCGKNEWDSSKTFCGWCGTKLPYDPIAPVVYEELERALKYALGEA